VRYPPGQTCVALAETAITRYTGAMTNFAFTEDDFPKAPDARSGSLAYNRRELAAIVNARLAEKGIESFVQKNIRLSNSLFMLANAVDNYLSGAPSERDEDLNLLRMMVQKAREDLAERIP
jgi:hypothetical protein